MSPFCERMSTATGKAGRNWCADETDIKVHRQWRYLYHAVDRSGALVDVMFSERRHGRRKGVLRIGQDGHRYYARPGHHRWAQRSSAGDPNEAGHRCAPSQQPVSQHPLEQDHRGVKDPMVRFAGSIAHGRLANTVAPGRVAKFLRSRSGPINKSPPIT